MARFHGVQGKAPYKEPKKPEPQPETEEFTGDPSETRCTLCLIECWEYIRIPFQKHQVCIPCSELISYELKKNHGVA